MAKENKLILIPSILIGASLAYAWTIIITTELLATWKHYLGALFYIGIVTLFFKSVRNAIIATGVYLVLATFNLLAITSTITTNWITIGPVSTPPVQLLSLGILVIYFLLSMGTLFEIYLDYKERKETV